MYKRIKGMTKEQFRNWVDKKTKKGKIKKSMLKDMGFIFLGKVGVKYLEHGDALCALKAPDKTYLVRSVLSPHEKPFLTEKELIYHLSKI